MIYFDNVSKIYDKSETYALTNIELAINDGEFVFLVGMSGAGKSTLIKLLQSELGPTYGKVIVNDTDTSDLSSRTLPRYRRMIGMIFQDFRLLTNKTVYENVAFAMQILGKSGKQIRQDVPYALRLVGLEDKEYSYPTQLSGGEQQRIAIARAIVNNPKVLIADEPTGNLDPDNSWEIMNLLERINLQGTTVLMATHNSQIVNTLRHRVIAIENGRVVRDEAEGEYGYDD